MIYVVDEKLLEREVLNIDRFFHSLISVKLSIPQVRISNKINDAEEYWDGVITLNPSYLKGRERISQSALIAHGFFHHVQHTKFKFYDPSKLWDMLKPYDLKRDEVQDLVNNIFESSAMFFAAAYLTRKTNGPKRVARLVRYLHSKPYAPPARKFIGGNDMILLAYSRNGHSVSKTLQCTITYKGQAKMVRDFFNLGLQQKS